MLLKDCPVRDTIDVIHGKWKPLVLVALKPGSRRFGQLCREVPEAKQKVLTQQLRELEADGIVSRTVSGADFTAKLLATRKCAMVPGPTYSAIAPFTGDCFRSFTISAG
jgi:hypothetical protein